MKSAKFTSLKNYHIYDMFFTSSHIYIAVFLPVNYLYSLMYRVAVNPPDLAREDWTIIRALSEVIYNNTCLVAN